MKTSVFFSLAVAGTALLAGCTSTPVPESEVIIPYEATLDTIHNRDDSVWKYEESRAGAVVREKEFAHVLYNNHYEADPVEVAKIEAAREKAQETSDTTLPVDTKNPKADPTNSNSETKKTDRSVYSTKASRDKSIYSSSTN